MDNPGAPQHVQRASFALGGLGFMLEQLAFTVEALQFVGENEPVFAGQGTVRDFCDAFADFPGITNNPGFLDITWRDNGDGFLSFGDDFDALFTECWEDDPGDAEDELLDGTVFFNDYYEAIDGNCRVVGAGFDDVQYDVEPALRRDRSGRLHGDGERALRALLQPALDFAAMTGATGPFSRRFRAL
jgi:hypothetical protein